MPVLSSPSSGRRAPPPHASLVSCSTRRNHGRFRDRRSEIHGSLKVVAEFDALAVAPDLLEAEQWNSTHILMAFPLRFFPERLLRRGIPFDTSSLNLGVSNLAMREISDRGRLSNDRIRVIKFCQVGVGDREPGRSIEHQRAGITANLALVGR